MPASKKANRKKVSDIVRLVVPVFFDSEEEPGDVLLNSHEILNGAALYGDFSKREGLRHALAWADKNHKQTRIVEIVVSMGEKRAQGASRLDENMIMSGEYGMIRLEKYAIKIDLHKKIELEIEKEAARLYPNTRQRTAEEWLLFDPSIARVLFSLFPIEVMIINSATPYTPKGESLSVAIIRDPKSIVELTMLYEKFKVKLGDA